MTRELTGSGGRDFIPNNARLLNSFHLIIYENVCAGQKEGHQGSKRVHAPQAVKMKRETKHDIKRCN